ncbi:PQQ-binding-like beta-propeller repeat protein [Limnospira platensis]|uniref:PQQ-binding-like beta-propeller repeat protein n=1 Tax=Limnospira platensis TaxID=118562 RepID=UPI00339753B4
MRRLGKSESNFLFESARVIVYFGSADSHFYALDANTGQQPSRFQTENWIRSSPDLSNGIVFFGSGDNHLYADK